MRRGVMNGEAEDRGQHGLAAKGRDTVENEGMGGEAQGTDTGEAGVNHGDNEAAAATTDSVDSIVSPNECGDINLDEGQAGVSGKSFCYTGRSIRSHTRNLHRSIHESQKQTDTTRMDGVHTLHKPPQRQHRHQSHRAGKIQLASWQE
ncbi:hypothetical protein R6Z07F_013057 [Ovis aries]